ncbi:coiled-coil domain-containing protein [Plantactinospora sp. GCM10030261]|uniref:coiled-coil domain-containing protein n=1 Tax=Plantactinospora sp. GCM10030261 TaxID=3273420 RepID=UPI00361D867C
MEGTTLVRGTAAVPGLRLILVVVLTAALGVVGTPAFAEPGSSPGDEGDSKKLRVVLEAAAKGHVEAQAKLDASAKRQRQLAADLGQVEQRLSLVTVSAGAVASRSYQVGRLGPVDVMMGSANPDEFLERARQLEMLAQRDNEQLRELAQARADVAAAKAAIDNEVREQQRQVAVLAQKKRDAERALAEVGGQTSGGFVSASSRAAKPAPRNSDGSWPSESCSVDDPTTSGCITPRTLHAYQQARGAGFTRHTSCFRSGGGGEHPKGRACDFSAAAGGFENRSATGGDKSYGDRLAAFYVKNASRLGVLYVIWYRQIWMPGTGWRAYSGGGSPAADHTNHVHLSMI